MRLFYTYKIFTPYETAAPLTLQLSFCNHLYKFPQQCRYVGSTFARSAKVLVGQKSVSVLATIIIGCVTAISDTHTHDPTSTTLKTRFSKTNHNETFSSHLLYSKILFRKKEFHFSCLMFPSNYFLPKSQVLNFTIQKLLGQSSKKLISYFIPKIIK